MTQNISSAVMNQRVEPSTSHDYFGTPAWATRSVVRYLQLPRTSIVLDPACGRGHMLRPLAESFDLVMGSDIQDLGFGAVRDFLQVHEGDFGGRDFPEVPDWIFLNPPFRLAADFIRHSLSLASEGVAALVRTNFAETRGRYTSLFRDVRPTYRLQFVDRVVMHKGDPPDPDIAVRVWDEKKQRHVWRKPSTATSYEWMVWQKGTDHGRTEADWLAYPRSELTKPGDYLVPDCQGENVEQWA